LERGEDVLSAARVLSSLERRKPRELGDIRSGDKRLVPSARDDQTAQARVRRGRRDRLIQETQDLGVQGIQLFRTVDGDRAGGADRRDGDELAHLPPPYS